MKIKKVIFPVAGLGTRFLPLTKSVPKEFLPLAMRPVIEWGVAEAYASGAREFIFITAPHKPSIAAHFASAPLWETQMRAQNKEAMIKQSTPPFADARFIEIEQDEALGLGDAIYRARDAIGDEPFAVILPDDVIVNTPSPSSPTPPTPPCLAQMSAAYEGGNMIAVMQVAREEISRYGVLAPKTPNETQNDEPKIPARDVIEKPARDEAPSNLALIGRYILDPQIMDVLARTKKGAGGEVQLTDAISALTRAQTPLCGYRFAGTYHDCGTPAGWLRANNVLASEGAFAK